MTFLITNAPLEAFPLIWSTSCGWIRGHVTSALRSSVSLFFYYLRINSTSSFCLHVSQSSGPADLFSCAIFVSHLANKSGFLIFLSQSLFSHLFYLYLRAYTSTNRLFNLIFNTKWRDALKKKQNCAYVKTYQELTREKELFEYQNAKKKSYITVKPITTE